MRQIADVQRRQSALAVAPCQVGNCWSPEQIARRVQLDLPDETSGPAGNWELIRLGGDARHAAFNARQCRRGERYLKGLQIFLNLLRPARTGQRNRHERVAE